MKTPTAVEGVDGSERRIGLAPVWERRRLRAIDVLANADLAGPGEALAARHTAQALTGGG
ncbi:MAG: hypothetical protein V4739_19645 [Pseudomonadota bacterium]